MSSNAKLRSHERVREYYVPRGVFVFKKFPSIRAIGMQIQPKRAKLCIGFYMVGMFLHGSVIQEPFNDLHGLKKIS